MKQQTSIPKHVRSDLHQLGLSPQKLIFENERKGRYNIIAIANDTKYFVKINDPDISEEHTQKFRKELEFYKTAQKSNLYPNYIDSTSNILVLESLQAESLRHWIINYIERNDVNTGIVSNKFKQFVTNLQRSIEQLYFDSQSIPDSVCDQKANNMAGNELFVSHLASNCSRLFTSGPMNTSRGRVEQKWGTLLRTAYIKFFKRSLSSILSGEFYEPKLEPVHFDLHQDNVLVGDKGNTYIVDWESCRYGFWMNDIAFLSATIFALLRNYPDHYEEVDDAITNVIIQYEPKAFPVFDWVRASMKNAISTNRQFHHTFSRSQLIYGSGKISTQMMNTLPILICKRFNL